METRDSVYKALDSEREYQEVVWGDSARTLDEFILYIKGYSDDLTQLGSHTDDPKEKLNFVRKVGGLAVACMETHGAPLREIPFPKSNE